MGISEDARGGEEFARRNRCKRARSSGRLRAFVIFLATVWIAACSGSSAPPPPPPPVSGYVVKDPIAAATVNLYTITADGSKTLLGATTSDLLGFYSFNIAPATDSVILVEASGGSYEDEISATRVPLAGTLRADIGIGRWHGGVAFDATDDRILNTRSGPPGVETIVSA